MNLISTSWSCQRCGAGIHQHPARARAVRRVPARPGPAHARRRSPHRPTARLAAAPVVRSDCGQRTRLLAPGPRPLTAHRKRSSR